MLKAYAYCGAAVAALMTATAVGFAASPGPLPTGATIGAEGHATVLSVPSDSEAIAAARLPVRTSERGWYAEQHDLTEAEAQRRLEGQGKLQPEFQQLNARLRREQAGNFVGAMLRHQPDWAYVFYFKRNPDETLSRYTSEPKFEAAAAIYSEKDRERIVEPWVKRWTAEGIPLGFGLDAVYPTMDVQMGITEADYRTLAADRGWGEPPAPIVLKFAKAPLRPAVDPRIRPLLRGFANERYATLMQLGALGTGKLVLRDGCLKVQGHDGSEKVAVFHHETGIGLDADGYLALIDRTTGKVRGRVGEKLAWGAPNAIPEQHMVGLAELRAACPGELANIGNPESAAAFNARYGLAGGPREPLVKPGEVPKAPPPPPPPPKRR